MERRMKTALVTTPDKWERLQKDLHEHKVCGFDVEAVGPARRYSQANSKPFLNVKLSYLQGMSIAFPNEKAYYLPLRHKGPNAHWKWAEHLTSYLASNYDRVWAHNVKFDSRMLTRENFDGQGIPWHDSMLTAWMYFVRNRDISLKHLAKVLLDRESPEWQGSLIDKTGQECLEYTCHDALNTLQIGELLQEKLSDRLQDWSTRVEYPLAELLGRCEEEGVPLNVEKLTSTLGATAEADRVRLEQEWAELMKTDEPPNVGSAVQLQELFVEGFWMPLGHTKDGKFKTGKDVLKFNIANGRNEDSRRAAQVCLELRQANKAKGTYSDGFYEELRQWPDHRLHPEQNQMGTATTRLSSSNPNIQNQMARGDYAPLLRECYEAPPGWSYVAADFSQQEPRIFADLASRIWFKDKGENSRLYDLFMDGGDIHQANADTIGLDREKGKTWTMGFMMYGGSPFKASKEFGVSKDEAAEMIKANFEMYPEGPHLRDSIISRAKQRDPVPYVLIASGHRRYIPELLPLKWLRNDPDGYLAKRKSVIEKYGIPANNDRRITDAILSSGNRKALNTVIQGSGAAMTKLAMVKFDQASEWYDRRIVFMTHDEITVLCREGLEEKTGALLETCMVAAAKDMGYTVPFVAKSKWGKTWADLK
jgi:DNA polymerase-1